MKSKYLNNVTWNERILSVLNGTDKKKFWYTHRRVRELVIDHYGLKAENTPVSLSVYMLGLIKDGYIERAEKPMHLRPNDRTGVKEYIYRATGKQYVRQKRFTGRNGEIYYVDPDKAELGFRIWNENRRLPKWFRTMMQ